jgi:CHAT domain-containing protein
VSLAEAPTAGVAEVDTLIRQLLEQSEQSEATAVLRTWLAQPGALAQGEALLTGLKNESERHLVINTAAAEQLANLLVFAADQLEHGRFQALGQMAQGDVRRAQGRYPEAVALYEAGGQACLALGDEVGWARSRTGWVFASQFCGRGREALPVAEQAYAVLAREGEHLRAGGLSNNVAGVYYQLGEYEQALVVFDRAIGHFQAARTTLGPLADERIAKAMANKALALTLLGRFEQAIELCGVARQIFASQGEVASALRVDHFRASIYAGQGQYTRALGVHADALAEFERAGLDEFAVQVALDIITCHAGLNHHADALALAEDLAQRCDTAGAPTEAAKARFRCAQAFASLGDAEPALLLLDTVASAFESAGLTAELGAVALLRARLHLDERDWTAAQGLAEQAYALFAERGLVERRTQAELIRAHTALALGRPAEAQALATAALHTSTNLEALPLSHTAHHTLAHIAQARSQHGRALDEYEAAIGDLERVQRAQATELRTEFLGDKLRVYQDAIDFCLGQGQLERGFGYLERAKSRALVDYLASQPDVRVRARTSAEQELIDELGQLRDEHLWFYGRLHGHGPSSQTQALPETERATLRSAVADRERRIVKIHERLALLRNAEGLESLGPRQTIGQPTLPHVDEGTVLLEYVFWADRGAVFVVTSAGLVVEPLAVGAQALQRLLNRWQLNLESTARAVREGESLDRLTQNANGQLANLYRALIEPVAAHLRGAQRLTVVPYGPAHGVPFQALFDGRQYLTERLEVWISPSSSLLELCAQRTGAARGSALVVGYSGGLLSGVLDEARTVSRLLGGTCYLEADATRAAVLAEGSQHRILHLAAHGEARLDNPAFAHLQLADGQLDMADVFTLRLDGALVTLSACETGRSAVVGGDELVGLSRGFLFAGASTLVQSLWRVDDASTARLMQGFYTALCSGGAPGAALRGAQCSFIDHGMHPYVWAPFQVVGYGGPLRGWDGRCQQDPHLASVSALQGSPAHAHHQRRPERATRRQLRP